jgi:hypothetical protein
MFRRKHHRDIALILSNLNAEWLREHHCYFGGGTAIVLLHDEFRESVDIDFLVSDNDAFRELRLKAREGFSHFLRAGVTQIAPVGAMRIDQYGIRTQLNIGASRIKFEIVKEGRIDLTAGAPSDEICGVSVLSKLDMVASKLLANSDRWADAGVFSRDLIDLAMLNPSSALLRSGIDKTSAAYGDAVVKDLAAAIERLRSTPALLDRCMSALSIEIPKALLWQRIRTLGRGLSK